MLRYTIDRARPGLVAFYDIQPGNGAGLLQLQDPHEVEELVQSCISRECTFLVVVFNFTVIRHMLVN